MGRRISYTIWGCFKSSNDWLEWYEDVKVFFHSLKYDLTHFGITGDTYNSDKILTVSRKEKEFIKKLESNIYPTCVECYSLAWERITGSYQGNVNATKEEASQFRAQMNEENRNKAMEQYYEHH